MKQKIKDAANVIDKWLNWSKIGANIENKLVRWIVNTLEMVDGTVAKIALQQIVDRVPEEYLPVVEKYLDAIIAEDIELVATTTGEFVNVLVDIPYLEEEEEEEVINAIFLAIVKILPKVFKKK